MQCQPTERFKHTYTLWNNPGSTCFDIMKHSMYFQQQQGLLTMLDVVYCLHEQTCTFLSPDAATMWPWSILWPIPGGPCQRCYSKECINLIDLCQLSWSWSTTTTSTSSIITTITTWAYHFLEEYDIHLLITLVLAILIIMYTVRLHPHKPHSGV